MPKIDGYCGYCPRCQEFKDDDYGMWRMENNDIVIVRGCRNCSHQLTSMKTIKEHLPELLKEQPNV